MKLTVDHFDHSWILLSNGAHQLTTFAVLTDKARVGPVHAQFSQEINSDWNLYFGDSLKFVLQDATERYIVDALQHVGS
jgi:hypothetical protein